MFRKCFAAIAVLVLTVGGIFADEIKDAVFKKYEDGKATFTVGEKDTTFKVDEKATIKVKKEDVKLVDYFAKAKAGGKFTLTTEKDSITGAMRQKGK